MDVLGSRQSHLVEALNTEYLATHNNHKRQTSMNPWDSNQHSQQVSYRTPTPYTAQLVGSAN
jgi:hypothetical protein